MRASSRPTNAAQPVVRAIGDRTTNAELIADCNRLGYLAGPVLDVTYGRGAFWSAYRPRDLTTNDLDPTLGAQHHHDFRHLPWADRCFATVVYDPPYKLSGTSKRRGASALNARYGIGDDYLPVNERHALIVGGLIEVCRVARSFVLAKCADQVASGRVHWQTDMLTAAAVRAGWRKVDALFVVSYREQPTGTAQVHARRDYSTLLVFGR
jgi:hypothetical protein